MNLTWSLNWFHFCLYFKSCVFFSDFCRGQCWSSPLPPAPPPLLVASLLVPSPIRSRLPSGSPGFWSSRTPVLITSLWLRPPMSTSPPLLSATPTLPSDMWISPFHVTTRSVGWGDLLGVVGVGDSRNAYFTGLPMGGRRSLPLIEINLEAASHQKHGVYMHWEGGLLWASRHQRLNEKKVSILHASGRLLRSATVEKLFLTDTPASAPCVCAYMHVTVAPVMTHLYAASVTKALVLWSVVGPPLCGSDVVDAGQGGPENEGYHLQGASLGGHARSVLLQGPWRGMITH